MTPTPPGYKLFEFVTPVTVAGSPVVSQFFDTTGFTTLLPSFAFVTGTTALTVEGSFDGVTQDTNIPYSALTSGTAFSVLHPYVRFRIVQTVADATVTKIFMQARQ